jgi:hypothetical protein
MHDPLLVQSTTETVAELYGNAELVLSQGSTSMRSSISDSVKSSSTNTTHNSSPPPTYEDVKADDNSGEFIPGPEKRASEFRCDQNCHCVCHTSQKSVSDDLRISVRLHLLVSSPALCVPVHSERTRKREGNQMGPSPFHLK